MNADWDSAALHYAHVRFYTGTKKGISPEHADRLERIPERLNAVSEIKDMNYPGSFLHQLSGDKKVGASRKS